MSRRAHPYRRLARPVPMLAVLLLAGACSGEAATGPEPATSPPPATVAPSAPQGSGSATPTATPTGRACFEGEYVITDFRLRAGSTTASGSGGDIRMTFEDGRYTLRGGEEESRVTLAGRRLELTVDGTVTGRYRGSDDLAVFSTDQTTGQAYLSGGGDRQTFDMQELATVITPQGTVKATCSGSRATFTSAVTRIRMTRA